MKEVSIKTESHTIQSLCNRYKRGLIIPPPYQRESTAWSKEQESMLIDSLLRGWPIPKLYVITEQNGQDTSFSVVDGMHRIRTVHKFLNNEIALPEECMVGKTHYDGKTYEELSVEAQTHIAESKFDLVLFDRQTLGPRDEQDLFQRLQSGKPLTPSEIRHAIHGNMSELVHSIAQDEDGFCKKCLVGGNKKRKHDKFIAMMMNVHLNDGPAPTSHKALTALYKKYSNINPEGKEARDFHELMKRMTVVYGAKGPRQELKQHLLIPLFLITKKLPQEYAWNNEVKTALLNWVIDFGDRWDKDRELKEAMIAGTINPSHQRDPLLLQYDLVTTGKINHKDSVYKRLNMLWDDFILFYPQLQLKDPTRPFNERQKAIIFRRYDGTCQNPKCGHKCDFTGDWAPDHIHPHAKGGPTTIENGQVLCGPCNRKKSDKTLAQTSISV